MKQPFFWGIRHLSPAGAYHLRQFLGKKRPKLVLVEGPSDLNDQMENITRPETIPPIAIMAYTKDAPVRTILYPFAEYSPEYQAILWCHENHVECRFMDLPSDVFLALPSSMGYDMAKEREKKEQDEAQEDEKEGHSSDLDEVSKTGIDIYDRLDQIAGEGGHETFWERVMEQARDEEGYQAGANSFGAKLRELTLKQENDRIETLLREAYMKRQIQDAIKEGLAPDEIVVVTGAYHVEGLSNWDVGVSMTVDKKQETADWDRGVALPMSDEKISALPRVEANHTLMPYSYYRLSTRSGYGAGNKAPAYYELLWEALCRQEPLHAAYSYLSRIAGYQRRSGNPVSSAEVIEAVRLACSISLLRNGTSPALIDLRDAAVTCLGHGSLAAISLAVADTEIGTRIGALPDGVSRTSIQEDFYRQLKEYKLEKYRDITAQDLKLDLRENRNVKSEKAAFLDLYRSFFLHQLRVLGVNFASEQKVSQENATWAEYWILRWTPEAEIQLVEAALKGDTVAQAASFCMKERCETATNMGEIAKVIEDAFTCGMEEAVQYATEALKAMAVEDAALEELAVTVHRLSVVIQYGNIRKLDQKPLIPILNQLFLRACLILPGACICDDNASKGLIVAMEQLNAAGLAHDFLDEEMWLRALNEVSDRDDLNTRLSGFAAAILLERGQMDGGRLHIEVQRRLSRGVPADLGAGWFEGLAMKNRYALIARLSLWESLDQYLNTLEEEEFKRALVFLRRAFADFTSLEKDEIAENLGEIWGLNGAQVSEIVNAVLDQEAGQMVENLDDFDFDF